MVSANHTTQVTAWAELAIRRINDYLNANKLKLNPDKTKIITFTKGNQPKVSLVAGGEHIESKTHTKLLGNYIHESLTWKKNSGILLGQPTDRLQSLRIMRKHTSFKVIKQIANGIIMGKINFAIQLWSGMPDYMALKFQKVLNSAARICIGSASNRYSTFKLLRSMGWLSFRQQAEYMSSQLINQIVKTSTPTLLCLKIKSDPIHPTRNNESIGNYPRHWNKMVSRTSFMYRGVKDYNTLPLNLRTEKNKIIFKKKLKVHIEKK